MLFLQVIRTAFRGILANKMRTSLTMLGIIIGVASIIAMLSIGEGAKRQVMESISRFGTNLLRVRPGAAMLGHVRTSNVETRAGGGALRAGKVRQQERHHHAYRHNTRIYRHK